MSNLIAHYAGSTGRLEASVRYAATVLRIALEHKDMPPERLRESMQRVLDEANAALALQKERDEALGWRDVQPREAA
jgi:hypothetical protein